MHSTSKMMFIFLFVFLIVFSSCECTRNNANGVTEKLDVRLRKKVETEDQEEVSFFIECNTEISDDLREEIENTGVVLETITGNLSTARGWPNQIKALAERDFIVRLRMAKSTKLLNQNKE